MKISARDIHVFVAGALALLGTRALLYVPYYFSAPVHDAIWAGRLFYSFSAGLDLPLGLAMLFGKRWAMLATQIWLWLSLVFSVFVTLRVAFIFRSSKALSYIWSVSPDLVIFVVLLLLIYLSRLQKFQGDHSR